jgi:hypothetical protein
MWKVPKRIARTSDIPFGRRGRLIRGATAALAFVALAVVVSNFEKISDPVIPVVAGRVARGETYDPALLRKIVADNFGSARRHCNAKALRDLLIVQLGAAEGSVHALDLSHSDTDTTLVEAISRALLSCAPTESIGWLGEYWSSIRQEGFGPRAVTYLANSYRFAPHEAWIQLIRAPLAFRSFEILPPALQEAAVQDFSDILDVQIFPSAAMLFKAAPITVQAKLLDRTCELPQGERLVFAHFVEQTGSRLHHRCYPADDRPSFMKGP